MADRLYLLPDEAAARLGKSGDYWRRKAKADLVPHVRVGRTIGFTEADIDAILNAAHRRGKDPLRDDAISRGSK
jgi:hypothetical protein